MRAARSSGDRPYSKERIVNRKQLPIIEEAPLIVAGFAVAAAASLAATALLGTVRLTMHVCGLDRPAASH